MQKKFPIALIKIGQKKFMESLLHKGEMKLNTINYYRVHKNKEIGDSWENPKRVFQGTISFFDEKNNEFIDLSNRPLPICELNNEKNGNVFCMYGVKASNFVFKKNYYIIKISKELINEFGGTVIFFPQPELFLAKVERGLIENGYSYKSKFVEYFDKNSQRILDLYCKRNIYKHHSEYRIFVKNNRGSILNIKLGSLENIALKIDGEKIIKMIFNNETYIIQFSV